MPAANTVGLLSPSQVATLLEMSRAGWSVPRIAQHFRIRYGGVREVLAAHASELLPVRRTCQDPLPTLPPRCGEDDGARALRLMRYWLT